MNNMRFGDKLLVLRKELDKSQADVAKGLGISQSSLSALEQRESAPRQEVLDKLCEYFQVEITYFFDTKEETKHKADIRNYIEALRLFTPDSPQRFAHSSRLREDNDKISRDLDQIADDFLNEEDWG